MDYLIDYERSVEECFIQVAFFLLPVLGLKLLTAVRYPHAKDMPSWIPDWSQNLPIAYTFFQDESPVAAQSEITSYTRILEQKERTTRSYSYQGEGNCLYLLVTGCPYAQIVERSQEFRFNNMDDVERQMKRLFSSLINLRQFVDAEGTCDNPTMSDELRPEISNAMSLINGSQLLDYLTHWYTTRSKEAYRRVL
ncbi:hypothetical protein N0V90_002424 [Kalmusia sp. IMI 367209]|nr:hypothetical protein N0V90_002424 [Kalmusia sp. IMI 367209]